MYKLLYIILLAGVMINYSCHKSAQTAPQNTVQGKWIVKGTDGSGPAGTLYFTTKNNKDILSFDCYGSPGPGWPSHAETEYKFENGKLVYFDYSNTTNAFYTVDSFTWITEGQEFEVKRRQLLLYMSADYTIRYVKVN